MTAFSLNVLGCGSGGPRPGVGASGYLLTTDRTSLVLDLGSGTLQPMFDLLGGAPDAVVITHRHVDHMADLLGLYGFLSSSRRTGSRANALRVIAPQGVEQAFAGALQAGEQHAYRDILAFELPRVGEVVSVGDLDCGFAETVHSVSGVAVRVTCGDSSITYTGDTGPNHAIEELALGCDVLLAEAANVAGRSIPYPFHMTVPEALDMALAAQTSDLVLTHMNSANTSEQVVDDAADAGYAGRVHIAVPGFEMRIDKEKT